MGEIRANKSINGLNNYKKNQKLLAVAIDHNALNPQTKLARSSLLKK
jgi:hypothetical protein